MPGLDVDKVSIISGFHPNNPAIPQGSTMSYDHPAIMDPFASVFVDPNKWSTYIPSEGKIITIPAWHITQPVPPDLVRYKKQASLQEANIDSKIRQDVTNQAMIVQTLNDIDRPLTLPSPPKNGGEGRKGGTHSSVNSREAEFQNFSMSSSRPTAFSVCGRGLPVSGSQPMSSR